MRKKITVRRVLSHSKNVQFSDVPFITEILLSFPEDVDVSMTETCQSILRKLEEANKTEFLKMEIERLFLEDDVRKTKRLIRWCYIIGLLSSFGTLVAILAYSFIEHQNPDGWLIGLLVGIPAGIMWKQAGLLKAETMDSLSKVLSNIKGK